MRLVSQGHGFLKAMYRHYLSIVHVDAHCDSKTKIRKILGPFSRESLFLEKIKARKFKEPEWEKIQRVKKQRKTITGIAWIQYSDTGKIPLREFCALLPLWEEEIGSWEKDLSAIVVESRSFSSKNHKTSSERREKRFVKPCSISFGYLTAKS